MAAYWKLNNSLVDSMSNGNTLTAVNSPSFSTNVPFNSELLAVRKTSNESVTNSSTLQTDDDLTLSLGGSKTFIVEGVIFASSTPGATPDIIMAFNGESGADIMMGYSNGSQGGALVGDETSERIAVSPNGVTAIHVYGTIVTSSDGNFSLKWTQSTSNAAATTVLKGSYLRAEEI